MMNIVTDERDPQVGIGDSTHFWVVGGESVRGNSHRLKGIPNQDAIGWRQGKPRPTPLTLAVADGHGSPAYYRSDVGARLAVEAALNSIDHSYQAARRGKRTYGWLRGIERRLPHKILSKWRRSVSRHFENHPSPAPNGCSVSTSRHDDYRCAYGSTLLVVVIDSDGILFCQIGDGDILEVSSTGMVQRVFPPDPRFLGNETTSLSSATTADFRTTYREATPTSSQPALIVAATDGYSNSFEDEDAFLRVGIDYLEAIRRDGWLATRTNMMSWLQETSSQGSGDDISVGLIWSNSKTAQPGFHCVAGQADKAGARNEGGRP